MIITDIKIEEFRQKVMFFQDQADQSLKSGDTVAYQKALKDRDDSMDELQKLLEFNEINKR